MFFYGDTNKAASDINVWKMNGTKAYLRHYDNLLFLDFVAKNGTFQEKLQAEKEIPLCHKTLKFWERHPNFVPEDALAGVAALKKNWTAPR